jgi:oligopeptide/dipeptide ABC transporter ATP-binding protein
VEHGEAGAIFKNPQHPYTKGLLGSVPRVDCRTEGGLYSIPGTPPDLLDPPEGCAFAARCEHAMNICRRCRPEYTFFEENEHYAACWLHHRKAGGADGE